MIFAQLIDVDNDLRDSGEFVHHYFALLFILLHFLDALVRTLSEEMCV